MATSKNIPRPPGTPNPPLENGQTEMMGAGLGLEGMDDMMLSPNLPSFDSASLSPKMESFAARRQSFTPSLNALAQPMSPAYSVYGSMESTGGNSGSAVVDGKGPFNFQPMELTKSPITKSGVGQRRGHKYKHSSVSHQIFLEPTPRAPMALPNSLPIPTMAECRKSMTKEQNIRFWWSICHAVVAGYTLWSASGSLALTALSHLILFDSIGAMICVVVDVLSNFEVWKRSSIRHPFGLERAEVLAGFATSVLLLFMGMDLISHNLQHILEEVGEHEAHVVHEHERVSAGGIDTASLLAIVSTVISAVGLKNHARIGKVMRFAYIDTLPSILSNPSHFLTITCSSLLLILPLLSVQMYTWLDRALSGTIALCMCVLGGRLVHMLGLMLLMSYSGNGVQDVIRDIETDPSVAGIEEAKFWQVHYGLCMANIKLRVRGSEDNLVRLRERITSMVRNRLGGGYGSGGTKWEVSTQMMVEKY